MESARNNSDSVRPPLGLWDATSIVVGIIIGVGIFETPRKVFAEVPDPLAAIGVWCLGGVLAMVGALCFAELASTYPRSGGEYVYLTRAFGPLLGFLFAWAQLAVIRPATIAVLAYIFAHQAQGLIPLPPLLLALTAVVVLSAINLVGVTLGAHTQNVLTAAKLLGLAAIVVAGFSHPIQEVPDWAPRPAGSEWFASTMILVLWTYAGWHEAAYIASEVQNSRRNLPLSLILGTLSVTLIYVLVNLAILWALGFDDARVKQPADIFQGEWGKARQLMIMVSALGAVNGMIFTTARIFSAFGNDHRLFTPLSHWSRRWGTPARALVIQGILGVTYLLLGVMTELIKEVWLENKPILELFAFNSSIVKLESLDYWIGLTAAVFWWFFLLTGISLFVLRFKDAELHRPFRAPLYPVLPLVFCGWCGYMVFASVINSPTESLFGLLVLLAGLPFYYLPQKRKKVRTGEEAQPLVGAGRENKV